jgi:sugar phosphate permease
MGHINVGRPSRVRYGILVIATLVALLLYLDRYCLSTADKRIQEDMNYSSREMDWIQSAFFLTYALFQIPMGRCSDRFGVRATLGGCIICWSAFTGLIGAIVGVADFVVYRLGCGLFEAGAYPACAALIRKWFPENTRGMASGIVSLGGRFGGTVAPLAVYLLIEWFGWRPVMAALGACGIAFGVLFLLVYRNRPRQHAWCNEAEVALIEGASGNELLEAPPSSVPWGRVLTHPSLWLSCFIQVGVNFGWVFILTNLNRFLADYYEVPGDVRKWMVFTVMVFNLPALILGGRLTDAMTTRYGRRWGRALPMALPRLASAAFYLAIGCVVALAGTDLDPWVIILLLGGMAFFSDLGLPAIWGFNLDVGKRHVGLVLGWGNMWGNLGAFFTPHAVNWMVHEGAPTLGYPSMGWPAVFWMFGLCFVVIGIAALFIRADDPLEQETGERAA